MILFAALGLAAGYLFAWQNALPLGALLGLIVAPLVPAKGACSLPRRDDEPAQGSAPR